MSRNPGLQISRYTWIGLGVLCVLLLGLFLRTYNLLSIPIFADEAIYVRWAQVMKAESTLRFLPLSDGKQPLFMWSVIPFLKIFSDPLVAGRMVSVLSGIAGVIGIFFLTLHLFKSKTAALAASVFYAVSPFTLFFDRMALVDSMLTAFGVWALYFGILTAQKLRLDFAMLTGFALGAAWLTKSPGLFFLLLLPVTLLVSSWPKKKDQILFHGVKLGGLWVVSWFIAFVIYNIQRLGPNFHMLALRNKDYVFSLQEALQHPFDPLKSHLEEVLHWWFALLPGSLLILVLLGGLLYWKRYWREIVLLISWTIIPLLVMSELAKVFTARYILFTIPPLFILAAIPFAVFKGLNPRLVWLGLLTFLAPAFWVDYLLLTRPQDSPLPRSERSGYLEEWTAGTGIREVAGYIKAQRGQNGIVVGTEGFFGTLPDGLQIYLEKIPNITVIGVGITISEVHESLLEAKKAGNGTFLVVNSTRFKGDADKLGLKLINSYPKAQRPNGSQESLLFFEVTEDAISPKTAYSKN